MLPIKFDFTGKVAVITGASRGIGKAAAEIFAEAGAAVVISSRKQEALDAVAREIERHGGKVLAIAAHTGDAEAVENLISRSVEAFGGVDILVNNAATSPHFGPVLGAEESQWLKTLDVNLLGYFRTTRAVVPVMRARGGGKIINVASIAGIEPMPGMGVYAASKAAVISLTKTLALELAPDNIKVNAVAPGFVKTRFSSVLWSNEEMLAKILKLVPVRRIASPEEIATLIAYLASPLSDYMTGEIVVIDGGQHLGSAVAFG